MTAKNGSVAILGSACDPPTLAHLDILNAALTVCDQAWIMPCHTHRYGKQMAKPYDRYEMCWRLGGDSRIKPWDYEIKNKLSGETYSFVRRLKAESFAKDYDFYYILGMDNANTFFNWVNYSELLQAIPFIVVARHNHQQKSNWFMDPPHRFLKADTRDTSSTAVRQMIREGQPKGKVCNHIPSAIYDYIAEKGLYKDA
jgi:nicotinate (nicotinamide) nucleotide adenylyltransferase